MTAAQSLLVRGLVPLEQGYPHTFTVEGVDGVFDCLQNDTTYAVEPGEAGARYARTAFLSFRRSVPYTPKAGDIITVDGVAWRVAVPVPSDIKWDLNLVSVDE
jgi:hypothetical protein